MLSKCCLILPELIYALEFSGGLKDYLPSSLGLTFSCYQGIFWALFFRNFLRSLPDGGRKVRAFVDTLHRIITERKQQERSAEYQTGEDLEARMLVEDPQGKSDASSPAGTAVPRKSDRVTSQFAKLRDRNTASEEVTNVKSSLDDEDFCLNIQSLSVRDQVSMDRSEADTQLAQLMNTAQRDKIYVIEEHPKQGSGTVNSYFKVMQKAEQASTHKKEHFKPNR